MKFKGFTHRINAAWKVLRNPPEPPSSEDDEKVDTEKAKTGKNASVKSASLPKKEDALTSIQSAGVVDLEKKIIALEKVVGKHHEQQWTIIIGVLIASVLIVVAVGVEVLIFNGEFRSSLDAFQAQQNTENQTLQTNIQNEQSAVNQELLNLKLKQTSP